LASIKIRKFLMISDYDFIMETLLFMVVMYLL